ncbi:F-box domain-containing protein [Mycena indigotica]|uniref:F-box domain-containing protein n=1 Tax=Mycena indigotica TaxID=2126181 RepID=A0A8H6SGP3_9AGAR|nr:F-box domain-containing protein [Mycena indigotica]KAF7298567.1 F-box domain-containing protein [Mycena indigotica]
MPLPASPYQAILHTNTVPTDAQCDEIRAYLSPHNTKLDEMHAEMHSLRERLRAIAVEADELSGFVDSHQALISPMRRMPNDVLQLIFLETLPAHRNTALDASEGPMLLASVCSHWRALALSMPKLWSRMHLVVHPMTTRTQKQQLALLAEMNRWLTRGSTAPLDVSAQRYDHIFSAEERQNISLHMPANPLRVVSAYLSVLISVSHRWRDIKLSKLSESPEDGDALFQLRAIDVPRLEKFRVHAGGSWKTPYNLEILSTPSLRAFVFKGVFAALPTTIIWRNLVDLSLQFFDTDKTQVNRPGLPLPFPFLSECTSLERLVVTAAGHVRHAEPESNIELTTLPKLTTLVLRTGEGYDDNATPKMFATLCLLRLPLLHTLDISGLNHERSLAIITIVGDVLKNLAFSCEDLTSGEVLARLRAAPLVERLRLVNEPQKISLYARGPKPPRDGQLLAHIITNSINGPPICPALRHFELTGASALTDELLLQFILSRTPPVVASYPDLAQLAALNVTFTRERQIDIRDSLLEAIQSDELRLFLEYAAPVTRPVGYSALQGIERAPDDLGKPKTIQRHPDWTTDFAASRW